MILYIGWLYSFNSHSLLLITIDIPAWLYDKAIRDPRRWNESFQGEDYSAATFLDSLLWSFGRTNVASNAVCYSLNVHNLSTRLTTFPVPDEKNMIGCEIRDPLVIGCSLFPGPRCALWRFSVCPEIDWREWLPVEVRKNLHCFV